MQVLPKTGDLFGVELECEGKNIDWDTTPEIVEMWAPHRDGSLRNYHGQACEWVFNGPATYNKSVERVNALFDYFEKRKAKLVPSNRTSTHVHFNMGDKCGYQVVNLFILFTILEDILDRYCGEDRRGNLFCLSSRHAEEQVRWVSEAVFDTGRLRFRDENRYCSLNLASLNKFGTVEFRGMRGLDKREDILSWLSIINELCDYACYKMNNPITLVEQISVKTPAVFLSDIFSDENVGKLTNNLTNNQIHDSVYEGLRLVQMLCYRIGAEFDGVVIQAKDFWASFDRETKDTDQALPEAPQNPFRVNLQNPFDRVAEGAIRHLNPLRIKRALAQEQPRWVPRPIGLDVEPDQQERIDDEF